MDCLRPGATMRMVLSGLRAAWIMQKQARAVVFPVWRVQKPSLVACRLEAEDLGAELGGVGRWVQRLPGEPLNPPL